MVCHTVVMQFAAIRQGTIVHTKAKPANAENWPTAKSLRAIVAMFVPGKLPVFDGHNRAKPIGLVLKLYIDSSGEGLVAVLGLTSAGAQVAKRHKWLSPQMLVHAPTPTNPNPLCDMYEVSIVEEPGTNFTAHSEVVGVLDNVHLVTASASGVGSAHVGVPTPGDATLWTFCSRAHGQLQAVSKSGAYRVAGVGVGPP
jgi:hypothetical protein